MIPFTLKNGLIVLEAVVSGPAGQYKADLVLDTGATSTVISKIVLNAIGYDPDALPQNVQFTTGSRTETACRIVVDKIEALGQEWTPFSVVAHNLPPNVPIDGLLGLDFFRNSVLLLDFQKGKIILV